mgnify:CR=1 FL=1
MELYGWNNDQRLRTPWISYDINKTIIDWWLVEPIVRIYVTSKSVFRVFCSIVVSGQFHTNKTITNQMFFIKAYKEVSELISSFSRFILEWRNKNVSSLTIFELGEKLLISILANDYNSAVRYNGSNLRPSHYVL